jgi:hypothetical protein
MFVPKRLVELAMELKELVVVAEVPVAFMNVKFWRVEEPTASIFVLCRLVVVAKVVQMELPAPLPARIEPPIGVEAVIPSLACNTSKASLVLECWLECETVATESEALGFVKISREVGKEIAPKLPPGV